MINVRVRGSSLAASPMSPVTAGSVGLPVRWSFSEEWAGLTKTAVFRGSGTARDVVLVEDACTVPHEVLTQDGGALEIGVRGWRLASDGETVRVVIPTIWGRIDTIYEGAEPSDVPSAEPSPGWAEMIQESVSGAYNKALAVEQAAERGDFDGATFMPEVSAEGLLSWTNDKGKENPEAVNIRGPQGIRGETGPQGERGKPFAIAKVYASVAAMNADYTGTDVEIGEFVVIDTGNVGDEDNAKLYCKGTSAYEYLTDLSGEKGDKGDPGEVTEARLAAALAPYRTAAAQDVIDAAQNTAINSKSTIEVWRLN